MAENTVASAGVEFYGDLTKLNQDLQRAEGDVIRAGNRMGDKAGKAFGERTGQEGAKHAAESYRREIAQALGNGSGLIPSGALTSLMGGGGSTAFGASLLSGSAQALLFSSNQAASMQGYREALTGIAKDAAVAGKALEELKGIAAATNYSTDEVLNLGVRMAGRDGNVSLLPEHMRTQLDAASAFGVQSPDFDAYQTNLTQMMTRGAGKIDVEDMRQFLNRAPRATSAVADAYGISIPEADKKLRSMSGDQFTSLLDLVASKNKGAAARAGGTTPQRVADQMQDDLKQGASDTGELVNTGLLPMFHAIHDGTASLREFNHATGGAAGLVGILSAAAIGVKLVKVGTEQATGSIGLLTGALRGLATAADGAAISTQAATVAEEKKQVVERITASTPGAMYDHAQGKYVVPQSIFPGGAAAASIAATAAAAKSASGDLIRDSGPASVMPTPRAPKPLGFPGMYQGPISLQEPVARIGPDFRTIGKGVGLSLLPMAIGMVGDAIQGDGTDPVRTHIGRDLRDMGAYGGLGGAIGSMFGPQGMLIGTGIGSAVGLGISEFQQYREGQQASSASTTDERTAKASEQTVDLLRDIKSKTIGGGPRTQWATSTAEREWALFHSMRMQGAGIG